MSQILAPGVPKFTKKVRGKVSSFACWRIDFEGDKA